jgi:hypothetical protein
MPPTSNPHAGDDNLRLIKGDIGRLRFRLNFLACQHGSYLILTFVIAAATAVMVAAFSLGALGFLAVGILTGIALVAASARVFRRAWRAIHRSYAPAAALADRRAGLSGRLLTIVSASGKGGEESALWSYLIQDTFQKRDAFALERIESRRIAPSIYPLLGSCLVAALVVLVIVKGPFGQASQKRSDQEPHVYKMTKLDLARLNLRPAEPGGEGGWKIEADPATMRELRKMLAARAYALNRRENSGAMAKLARKSGNLPDSLPPGQPSAGKQDQPKPNPADRGANGSQSDESAPRGGAGASHGPGTDPEHLYGKRSEYRDLSAKDFAIAVEARAARVGAHLPTKIQVSLNPQQHADEPVARV